MGTVLWCVAELAGWVHDRWRLVAVAVFVAVGLAGWACSNLTWCYRIATKDGEAVRVGITAFGRYHRRMREYRSGRDSSTRRGERWQENVRWWTPTIPARVARWCGCEARSETGVHPGWSRWFRTVELHRTRTRALAYEDRQIKLVRPRFNFQGKPRLRRAAGRAAA